MKSLFLFLILFFLSFSISYAAQPKLVTSSDVVVQGDPIMVTVTGVNFNQIKTLDFSGDDLGVSFYKNKPTAFVGIDLNKKPGLYLLDLKLTDGTETKKLIAVIARQKYQAPLGIPEKLGGNTPAAQTALVNNLSAENAELASIETTDRALWKNKFTFPLSNIYITDPYGYSRQTGSYSIAHKGADFRAAEGTSVVAMNDGVVRIAKKFTVYGNTIVIDHGFGISTMYMHLSEMGVTVGDDVSEGDIIGLSGQTGYAEHPHLHTTIRINNVSIDPMKFMEFFK